MFLPFEAINNPHLSLRSIGLLVYIINKRNIRHDWHFSAERISKDCKEGRDAIRKALLELENAGLIRREKVNDQFGVIFNELFVTLPTTEKPLPTTEKPLPTTEKPATGKPTSVFQASIDNTIQENNNNISILEKDLEYISSVDEFRSAINRPLLSKQFFYKIFDNSGWEAQTFDCFDHFLQKGKKIHVSRANDCFKKWLSPKFESEDDIREMKKMFFKKYPPKGSENNIQGVSIPETEKNIDTADFLGKFSQIEIDEAKKEAEIFTKNKYPNMEQRFLAPLVDAKMRMILKNKKFD